MNADISQPALKEDSFVLKKETAPNNQGGFDSAISPGKQVSVV